MESSNESTASEKNLIDKQTFKNESLMSELNTALKLNPLKICSVFFLVIFIYIGACEMIQYGFIKLQNIPKDTDHYRLFRCIYCIMMMFLGMIAIYCIIIFLGGLLLYVVDSFIPLCIRHWYDEEKQFYRWYQSKFIIGIIVRSLVLILWTIFAIELIKLLLFDFDSDNMSSDRLIVYRLSGFLILTLLSIVVFVGILVKRDPSYARIKRVKAQ